MSAQSAGVSAHMRMPSLPEGLLQACDRWLHSRAGLRVRQILQVGLTVATLAFVGSHLRETGLAQIYAALPRQPAFYVLFGVGYLLPPLSEYLSYRRLLPRGFPLPDLLRKRAFNDALFDYSGEAYLLTRAEQLEEVPFRQAAVAVKDVTLTSGLVSNSATLLMILGVFVVEHGDLSARLGGGFAMGATGGAIFVALLSGGVFFLRRRVISAQGGAFRTLVVIHSARLAAAMAMQVLQWSVVLPAVPVVQWFEVFAIWMLVTRIPFVPNRDLLLAGVGLSLADFLAAPRTTVVGLFVAAATLPLLTHVIVLSSGVFAKPRAG